MHRILVIYSVYQEAVAHSLTVTEGYNHVRIYNPSGFRDEFGSGGPDLVGITTMTSPYYFVPPSGSTAERPQSPPPGMLRFNTDIGRLEVWRNDHWATILGESPNLGDQNNTNSSGGTGTRAVACGGGGAPTNKMHQYIT